VLQPSAIRAQPEPVGRREFTTHSGKVWGICVKAPRTQERGEMLGDEGGPTPHHNPALIGVAANVDSCLPSRGVDHCKRQFVKHPLGQD